MTIKEMQRERLRRLLEAEEKILLNQSYKVGNHEFTRADLDKVRAGIEDLLEEGVTLEDEPLKNGRIKHIVFA